MIQAPPLAGGSVPEIHHGLGEENSALDDDAPYLVAWGR